MGGGWTLTRARNAQPFTLQAAVATEAATEQPAACGAGLLAPRKRRAATPPAGHSEEEAEEDPADVKKRRRLEKNRASAQLSRERRRGQLERLQAQVAQLQQDNCSLAYTLSVYHSELQRMHVQLAEATGRAPPAMAALPTPPSLPASVTSAETATGSTEHPTATTTVTTTTETTTEIPSPTQARGAAGADEPAALTSNMPSICLAVAISTFLQLASCYLGASLCFSSAEAWRRAQVVGYPHAPPPATCALVARSRATLTMASATGAGAIIADGACSDVG